ncbi:MAG: MotA/TolQ/ExbB proton channel family protein [Planctomycetota bacterium]
MKQLEAIWREATSIWLSGGWAMIALAVIATLMFGIGLNVLLRLKQKGHHAISERVWRRWIERPGERRGAIGEVLDWVTTGRTVKETAGRFHELRAREAAPFDRDLRVMKIFVSAAPLVGLLGTVTGMLTTFGALSSGSGGEKTMAKIAAGISEALVTTETGLIIALPGLFFQYQLNRGYQSYKAFLAHLEVVCIQVLHRRARQVEQDSAQTIARTQILQALRKAVS